MTELDEVTSPMARAAMEAGGVPTRPASATEVSRLGRWVQAHEQRSNDERGAK